MNRSTVVCAVWLLLACSSSGIDADISIVQDTSGTSEIGDEDTGSSVPDATGKELASPDAGMDFGPGKELTVPDLADEDLGADVETMGDLGEPCEGNDDCLGGFCVPSDIGYICSQVCIDDCPQGWDCKAVNDLGPDVFFVCLPDKETVCGEVGVCSPLEEVDEVCGKCGTRTRTCSANCIWGEWSNCYGEGECPAGVDQEESCGACGARTRLCSEECYWDSWSDCSDEGECGAGELATESCGDMCGERFRQCTDQCQWSDWSPCQSEGECAAGSDKTEDCGNCGTKLSICSDLCAWSEFGECTGEGECVSGDLENGDCGMCGIQTRQCTSDCQWSLWGACQNQGICVPGKLLVESCGGCGEMTAVCLESCQWGEFDECSGEGECTPGQEQPCDNCGTAACTEEWAWGECDFGVVDNYEENDSQPASAALSGISNMDGSTETIYANINPSFDPDYYTIHVTDQLLIFATTPTVTLTDLTAGQTYEVCIKYQCDKSDQFESKCEEVTVAGEVSFTVDWCTFFGVLGDDSGTLYIQIDPQTEGSCENYKLKIEA